MLKLKCLIWFIQATKVLMWTVFDVLPFDYYVLFLHFLSRDQSYGDNAKSKQPTQIFSFEVYHPPLILSKHSAISRLVHISWVIIWNLILLLRFFCFFLRFSEHQAELQIKLLFFLGIIMNKSKEYLYFIL